MQTLATHRVIRITYRFLLISSFVFHCAAANAAGPVGIGWTPHGILTTAGYIAPDGKLVLFDGGASGWVPRLGVYPHALVPGAPLVLLPQLPGQAWPTVITVSAANKLTQIVNGGVPQVLIPAHSFPVGAQLSLVSNGPQPIVMLVSVGGDLWSVDPVTTLGNKVNSPTESFPMGCSVSAVAAGGRTHAFAVDQFGTMHYYFGQGPTWGSMAIAGGLIPGTCVAADELSLAFPPAKHLNVSAIDPSGNLLLWSKAAGMPWSPPVVIAKGQAPGSPLQLGHTAFGPMLSTISSGGKWHVWVNNPATGWTKHLVGVGYFTGAPIAGAPGVGTFFTVDPLGRLISAKWNGKGWTTAYALLMLARAPQLVSREVVPNPPLPPASVSLINNGPDPLVVQIVDRFDPRQPPEETITAGGKLVVQMARDSGATLEEVFLVPGPGGVLQEQKESHAIPPEQRYTLTVWSDKETYKVLPFKGAKKGAPKSVTEGFSQRTQVSLGVIPIPAGELLRDGEQLDLVQITQRLKNAGAVNQFPKPVSQP